MTTRSTARRSGPNTEHAPVFFADTPSLAELAAQQGVTPAHDLAELQGTFWPESDSIDQLNATVHEWRSEPA